VELIFGITGSSPTLIKLFPNLTNPGFNDVEDMEASQALHLGPNDYDGSSKIPLKAVKFGRVNRLESHNCPNQYFSNSFYFNIA